MSFIFLKFSVFGGTNIGHYMNNPEAKQFFLKIIIFCLIEFF